MLNCMYLVWLLCFQLTRTCCLCYETVIDLKSSRTRYKDTNSWLIEWFLFHWCGLRAGKAGIDRSISFLPLLLFTRIEPDSEEPSWGGETLWLLGEMALMVVIGVLLRISGRISVFSSVTVSTGFFSFLDCVESPSGFLKEKESVPRKYSVGGSLFLEKNGWWTTKCLHQNRKSGAALFLCMLFEVTCAVAVVPEVDQNLGSARFLGCFLFFSHMSRDPPLVCSPW